MDYCNLARMKLQTDLKRNYRNIRLVQTHMNLSLPHTHIFTDFCGKRNETQKGILE